jgi:type II secretory pathway pseudopilin PulG
MIHIAKNTRKSGMTLMEVVIALGIIGFVLPIIIAATSSTGNARLNAEADTRSAWLARHIQTQIIAKWSEPPIESEIESAFLFPENAATTSSVVLLYNREGSFLSVGTAADLNSQSKVPQAVYVASASAEFHSNSLVLVSITISHPANALPGKRGTYNYKYLTTRKGNL